MGTTNREPQEYSRNIIGIYLPGSLYSFTFLLYSWGSLFGVPIRVPLSVGQKAIDRITACEPVTIFKLSEPVLNPAAVIIMTRA